MTSQNSSGGTGLLAVLAAATIFIVTLEGAFLAAPTVWMAGTVLVVLALVAVAVVAAVLRVIDHGSVLARPPRPAAPQPERAPAPRPVQRPVLGH
jgi:hypothetical protein